MRTSIPDVRFTDIVFRLPVYQLESSHAFYINDTILCVSCFIFLKTMFTIMLYYSFCSFQAASFSSDNWKNVCFHHLRAIAVYDCSKVMLNPLFVRISIHFAFIYIYSIVNTTLYLFIMLL